MKYATGEIPAVGDLVCRELEHDSSPYVDNEGNPLPWEGRNTAKVVDAEVSSTCIRTNGPLQKGDIPVYLACLLRKVA